MADYDWSQLQLSDLAPDDQRRLQAFVDYLLRKAEERHKKSISA